VLEGRDLASPHEESALAPRAAHVGRWAPPALGATVAGAGDAVEGGPRVVEEEELTPAGVLKMRERGFEGGRASVSLRALRG